MSRLIYTFKKTVRETTTESFEAKSRVARAFVDKWKDIFTRISHGQPYTVRVARQEMAVEAVALAEEFGLPYCSVKNISSENYLIADWVSPKTGKMSLKFYFEPKHESAD